MSQLERLQALEDIRTLKAKSLHAVDTQDWAAYEALHTPDYRAAGDGERPTGAKANTAQVAEALTGKITMHQAHTPVITLHSSTRASGVWAMEDRIWWKQGDAPHWLQGYGFYHETYEKRDGAWLIASRVLKRQKVLASPGGVIGAFRADDLAD